MALTWEDKEIRFDIPFSEMRLKSGEKVVDRLDSVEDTKGNAGDRGRLIITTLRALWHSTRSPRVNLCKISIKSELMYPESLYDSFYYFAAVGYNTILSISTKVVNSKLRGTTQALHLLTSCNSTRFEFIFTNLIPGNMRHFTSVMGVHKAYMSSKLYRELKLRGAVVQNKQLKILPLEQVFTTLPGVWNLSSDQGSLGTLIISNVRIVWFADMNEGFNISLPHLQIESIKIRDSKFGTALVITSGSYVLGFRIDPEDKLKNIFRELASLHSVYTKDPIYGVEFNWTQTTQAEAPSAQLVIDQFNEVEEPKGEMTNILTAYLADEGHVKDRLPVYSQELGFAIESVKDGYTLQKLWEVIPL